MARSDAGLEACLVPLRQAGVSVEPVLTFDTSRGHSSVTFDGAEAEVLETTLNRGLGESRWCRSLARLGAAGSGGDCADSGRTTPCSGLPLAAPSLLSGDQAQAGQYVCEEHACPQQRLLRRLGFVRG